MIKDQLYIFDKSCLNVPVPKMETLPNVMLEYQEYLNRTQDLINQTNNDFLSYLDNIAAFNIDAVKDLKAIYSILGDLYILNGRTSKSLDIYDLSKAISINSNIKVNTSSDSIQLSGQDNFNLNNLYSKISIKSVKILPKLGDQLFRDLYLGLYKSQHNSEINNILTNEYLLSLHSINQTLSFSIVVDLGDIQPVNNISFDIDNESIPAISIKSLEITKNNTYTQLQINNSKTTNANGYDILDTSKPNRSVMTINFDNQLTRFIKVDIGINNYELDGAKRIYGININNLKAGFFVPVENGSVIFGPLKFTDEVLKVSIDSDLENYDINNPNILFSISNAKDGSYQSIINSLEFRPEGILKNIVNYNNISVDALKTLNPVREIYIKIAMQSLKKKLSEIININISDIESYIQRNRVSFNRTNSSLFIGPSINSKESINVLRETNKFSGYNAAYQNGQRIITSNIIQHETNNIISGLSIGSDTNPDLFKTDYIVQNNQHKFTTKYEKAFIKVTEKKTCYFTDGYDKYGIDLFNFSIPSFGKKKFSTELLDSKFYIPNTEEYIYCLPLKVPAGQYKLDLNGNYVILDFSCGFITSVIETHFVVDNESITSWKLFNEIGAEVGNGLVLIQGTVRYISLFDSIISEDSLPSIDNFTFNKVYGIKTNSDTEFSLVADGYIFNKFTSAIMNNSCRIIHTKVNKAYNGKLLITDNARIAKLTETMTSSAYQHVYKLGSNRIVPGSVLFNTDNASINPFILEVEFKNGKEEFVLTELIRQTVEGISTSIIALDPNFYGDELSEVTFDGETDLFSNRVYSEYELQEKGDWFLDISTSIPTIKLPSKVKTSSLFPFSILYNVKGKLNSYGIYSIDYINGIIYSNAPMDDKIKVTYKTSRVFARYEHFDDIDNFSISNGEISIKEQKDGVNQNYLIVYNKLSDNLNEDEILITPKIKNIKVNILTKQEIL